MKVETKSLCPVCYSEIPATITTGHAVMMEKVCPDHGQFESMVERDPQWWTLCRAMGNDNIYDGYMIDVTDECNLKCKYCYHGNGSGHKSIAEIVEEAKTANPFPIILTGGEPTTHPDIPAIYSEVKKIGPTWILTNGVNLSQPDYLDEMCKAGLAEGGFLLVGLSFHKESKGKDIAFIELCRARGLKIPTAFWVIDNLDQMEEAVSTFWKNRDVISSLRIKAASNLWAEGSSRNHIFTSDMLKYLYAMGPCEIITEGRNNKTSFANVNFCGSVIMLISWYDKHNIDLMDIDCPPYYKSKDGTINNLVTTCLRNEAINASL